jgi:hypothetical protein
MAKQNQKLVAVKIARNVAFKNKIMQKDSVHQLPEEDATVLIDGDHATEHVESAQQQQQQQQAPVPTIEELEAEFAGCDKPELGKALAEAKKVKTGEARWAAAQAVISFLQEKLNK